MLADEARIREIGQPLLDCLGDSASPVWRLIDRALTDESLKLELFRLVDVLPALNDHREVARHVREYLARRDVPRTGRTSPVEKGGKL